MIIDEKLIQQRRALPSAPTTSPVTPVVSEKSRLAARHAVPLPDPLPLSPKRQALLQSAALANSRPPFAYNDTGTTVPSPPYSDRSSNTRTQSSYSSSSTTHPLIPSSQSQSQLHPTYPPLTPAHGAQPLHSVSKPSNGTITPNPLLFQARPGQAPQSSRPGDVTPNLLLLSNSPYARTQPSGMLGNVYPTAAPLAVPAEPVRCDYEKHEFETRYGPGGIILSIICFPVGLAALFFDQSKRCRRCGIKTDRHGHDIRS